MPEIDIETILKENGFSKAVDAYKEISDVIDFASDAFGYYGAVLDFAQMVGVLPNGPSDLEVAMDAIMALGEAVLKALDVISLQIVEAVKELKQDIQDLPLAGARTAIKDTLLPGDFTITEAETIREKTGEAVNYLQMSRRWRHRYHPSLAYEDSWVGTITPPAAPAGLGGWDPQTDGYQWSHTFTLTPFLEVVTYRVVAILGTDAAKFEKYKHGFREIRDKLRLIWQTMRDGIWLLPPPSVDQAMFELELAAFSAVPGADTRYWVRASRWEATALAPGEGGLYGAYDVWSGRNAVRSYPFPPPRPELHSLAPNMPGASMPGGGVNPVWLDQWRAKVDAWYESQVRPLHGLRTLNRWKEMYRRLDLDNVWRIQASLSKLLDEPVDWREGRTGAWSLRQSLEAIPEDMRPHSLRALANLAKVQPAAREIKAA